jgi:phospholipid/cholesterol/gamma-HCH transport system substrate-binding protein
MKNKVLSSEVKVGILVLVSVVVLFYMSFRIGKFGVFREGGYNLYVVFKSAAGIDPKTPVELAGVEIGKVSRVMLEGYKAKIMLMIRDDVQVPVDSKIHVKSQGVLGDKYIEIIPGSDPRFLGKGGTIREVVAPPDFDEIFSQVHVAAKNFGETMDQFRGVVGEAEKASIKKSIENIQAASGDFKDLLKTNKENVTHIMSNAAVITDKLGSMSDKADQTVSGLKGIVKDVESGKGTLGLLIKDDKLYKDATETVASLKTIAADIEQGKGTLGRLAKDDALYLDAKETAKNVREITDGIKKGEGTLGKLAKDDKLYVEAEKSLKKFQKAAEAIQEQTPITVLGTILGTFF